MAHSNSNILRDSIFYFNLSRIFTLSTSTRTSHRFQMRSTKQKTKAYSIENSAERQAAVYSTLNVCKRPHEKGGGQTERDSAMRSQNFASCLCILSFQERGTYFKKLVTLSGILLFFRDAVNFLFSDLSQLVPSSGGSLRL